MRVNLLANVVRRIADDTRNRANVEREVGSELDAEFIAYDAEVLGLVVKVMEMPPAAPGIDDESVARVIAREMLKMSGSWVLLSVAGRLDAQEAAARTKLAHVSEAAEVIRAVVREQQVEKMRREHGAQTWPEEAA